MLIVGTPEGPTEVQLHLIGQDALTIDGRALAEFLTPAGG